MDRQTSARAALALLLSLAFSPRLAVAEKPEPKPVKIDQQSKDVLDAFNKYHAGLKGFRLDSTIDEESFEKKKALQRIAGERPNKLSYKVTSEEGNKFSDFRDSLVCDGTILAASSARLISKGRIIAAAPERWRQLFKMLPARLAIRGTSAPAEAHLVMAIVRDDPAAALLGQAREVAYQGIVKIDGIECHWIKANGKERECQFWIATGVQPWLRRITIHETGSLSNKTVIDVNHWEANPQFAPDDFKVAAPPDGARWESKMDSLSLNDAEAGTTIDADARRCLQACDDHLRGLPAFRVQAKCAQETLYGASTRQSSTTVDVERPNRVCLQFGSPAGYKLVSDGSRMTEYFEKPKKYLVSNCPSVLDDLRERSHSGFAGGREMANEALYMLLRARATLGWIEDDLTGDVHYLGEVDYHGRRCHLIQHYIESLSGMTLTYRIDASGPPLLRGIEYTLQEIAGDSIKTMHREEIWLEEWDVNPRFVADTFHYTPPQSATRISSTRRLEHDEAPPLLDKPAPAATFALLDGRNVDLKSYAQKRIVVLHFWKPLDAAATWSATTVAKVAEPYQDRGVIALSISNQEEPDEVQEFLTKAKWSLPVALDRTGEISKEFYGNLAPWEPLIVIIDLEGVIRQIYEGCPPELEADLKKGLAEIVNRKPAPK